jgi:hypothetical protein
MSQGFIRSFRYLLAGATGFGALAAIAIACTSGGGGNIGDGCQSSADCQNQYECLAVDDAGACSNTGMTCQQACQSECLILGSNWVCTPMDCAGPGNSGICTLLK